jgi:sulfatase modifying factor 1
MRVVSLAVSIVGLLLLGACSLFVDTSNLDTGGDAGGDAPLDVTQREVGIRDVAKTDLSMPDASQEGAPHDAGTDSPSASDSGEGGHVEGGCPSGGGPSMVEVGGLFCIDSTETTNAQYQRFLDSSPSLASQRAECAFNATFVPLNWPYASGRDNYPVTNVDWCDADAFCKWAGKRICGAIGGGSFDASDYANPSVDQHFYACSRADARIYPYGNSYEPGSCNDVNAGVGDAVPVGSLASCSGGFSGLFDMVGNVEEWQDSCNGTTGMNDTCVDGDGAFDYPSDDGGPAGTQCSFFDDDVRSAQFPDVGIRCCSP